MAKKVTKPVRGGNKKVVKKGAPQAKGKKPAPQAKGKKQPPPAKKKVVKSNKPAKKANKPAPKAKRKSLLTVSLVVQRATDCKITSAEPAGHGLLVTPAKGEQFYVANNELCSVSDTTVVFVKATKYRTFDDVVSITSDGGFDVLTFEDESTMVLNPNNVKIVVESGAESDGGADDEDEGDEGEGDADEDEGDDDGDEDEGDEDADEDADDADEDEGDDDGDEDEGDEDEGDEDEGDDDDADEGGGNGW